MDGMRKHTLSILSVACFGLVSTTVFAECPMGFQSVGVAYASDDADFAEAKVEAQPVLVKFPRGVLLDKNYVQHGGRWNGGSARAVMTDADVPNGLMVIASGSEGGEKGWSVYKPELKVLEEAEDGRILQRGYEMKLYCHTGSGEAAKIGRQSCSVRAEFCAKLKKA